MTPEDFVDLLGRERASAILRTDDRGAAAAAMDAAVAGGFRVVEFTLTIPDAYGLIAEFARRQGTAPGLWAVAFTPQGPPVGADGSVGPLELPRGVVPPKR